MTVFPICPKPDMPVEADGATEDPPLLLHPASRAAPIVTAKAYLTRLEMFISNCSLLYFFDLHHANRQLRSTHPASNGAVMQQPFI